MSECFSISGRFIAHRVFVCSFLVPCLIQPLNAQERRASDSERIPAPKTEVFWQEAPALVPVRMLFPPDFDRDTPRTLIVALRGFGSSAEEFQRVGDQLAGAGFLVALPEAPYAFIREDEKLV